MKTTTIKLSLATLAVLTGTTLFAEVVIDGPSSVQAGETIHLTSSDTVAESGGKLSGYRWVQEIIPAKGKKHSKKSKIVTSGVISTQASPRLTAPHVTEDTRIRYTLIADETIANKNSIIVTVHPNRDGEHTIIRHENFSYLPVVSPVTGRTWLDRNLGATKVCTSPDDTDETCYGAYYQWGRNTDGHQLHDSAFGATVISLNTASDTFSEPDALAGNSGFYDWVDDDRDGAIREARWSATDGSSVCPVDYRVPTPEEYAAESNLDFLHLAYAGLRTVDEPNYNRGYTFFLWTSHMDSPERASALTYTKSFGGRRFSGARIPVDGLSVRCIKN